MIDFITRICVTREPEEGWLIVGTPDDLANLVAEDGQRVAIYKLVSIQTYRTQPILVSDDDRPLVDTP